MIDRLRTVIRNIGPMAVAVSGGVDSLTLGTVAHDVLGPQARMYHATSPAVPPEATERTAHLAKDRGWTLTVFDAGEFSDENYRANPVNRCFFCKTSLYGAIANVVGAQQIVSGTNLDDLGDYRPGLTAAAEHGVRHPFVEAGVDKLTVRAIAASLGLGSIADLPAAPCLSSRVETGIRIDPGLLRLVHSTETVVAAELKPKTVRCRIRATGIVVELDPESLERMQTARGRDLALRLQERAEGPVSFEPYQTGSAFLRHAS